MTPNNDLCEAVDREQVPVYETPVPERANPRLRLRELKQQAELHAKIQIEKVCAKFTVLTVLTNLTVLQHAAKNVRAMGNKGRKNEPLRKK